MSSREQYVPGPASGAEVRKEGEKWTLVLVRELSHPPARVWKALTEPEHLREWAPFDSDRNLGTVGTAKLSTVGAPTPLVSETHVTRADAPKVPSDTRVIDITTGTTHIAISFLIASMGRRRGAGAPLIHRRVFAECA